MSPYQLIKIVTCRLRYQSVRLSVGWKVQNGLIPRLIVRAFSQFDNVTGQQVSRLSSGNGENRGININV